ncbi:ATP-binding cassette domain-containing protein [Mesorhizobium marinum]|uniref:ATP-binding cassette domain-containing protein n=1 Tax=Mesorhizobium marinum TaxID=3228790 RepID=UPI003466680E
MFALARTAAKYGERIVGHKAALLDQVARRAALFSAVAMAPAVRSAGWQLGDQDRLSDFMDDVEDVDYARLRVGLPLKTLSAGFGLLALVTLVLAPLALAPVAAIGAVNVIVAWRLFPRAAADWGLVRSMRRAAARRLGVTLAAIVPLRAEQAWTSMLDEAFARLAAADDARLRARREQALLDCTAGLFGPVAALGVFATAWYSGSRGEALLPAAFLAFAWLALGESALGLSRILVARVRENAARTGIEGWTVGAERASEMVRDLMKSVGELELSRIPLCAPDGRFIGGAVDLVVRAGRPVVLAGPSGSGKTSLLKQVAGWLEADGQGRILADGAALDPAARRRIAHVGLHDAAILADTVRENLFAPHASDAPCQLALEAVELDSRVAEAGGLDAWITQDVLSLGEAQRLNLARALLSRLPVILLDEPTEHLDPEQAQRILRRLIQMLGDRVLMFSSHERAAPKVGRDLDVVRLGAAS